MMVLGLALSRDEDDHYCGECGRDIEDCRCYDDPDYVEWPQDEPNDEARDDVNDASDDGCTSCGLYAEDCRCGDPDYWPELDWDEMERAWEDAHDAENFRQFHCIMVQPASFQHLTAKEMWRVQDTIEEDRRILGYRSELGSWKRSNRNARKQWARHPKRVFRNMERVDEAA